MSYWLGLDYLGAGGLGLFRCCDAAMSLRIMRLRFCKCNAVMTYKFWLPYFCDVIHIPLARNKRRKSGPEQNLALHFLLFLHILGELADMQVKSPSLQLCCITRKYPSKVSRCDIHPTTSKQQQIMFISPPVATAPLRIIPRESKTNSDREP